MVIILFGGGDGGGFKIVNGHIVKIPPNNPEVIKAVAAVKVFQAGQSIKDPGLKKQAAQLAQALASSVRG